MQVGADSGVLGGFATQVIVLTVEDEPIEW